MFVFPIASTSAKSIAQGNCTFHDPSSTHHLLTAQVSSALQVEHSRPWPPPVTVLSGQVNDVDR